MTRFFAFQIDNFLAFQNAPTLVFGVLTLDKLLAHLTSVKIANCCSHVWEALQLGKPKLCPQVCSEAAQLTTCVVDKNDRTSGIDVCSTVSSPWTAHNSATILWVQRLVESCTWYSWTCNAWNKRAGSSSLCWPKHWHLLHSLSLLPLMIVTKMWYCVRIGVWRYARYASILQFRSVFGEETGTSTNSNLGQKKRLQWRLQECICTREICWHSCVNSANMAQTRSELVPNVWSELFSQHTFCIPFLFGKWAKSVQVSGPLLRAVCYVCFAESTTLRGSNFGQYKVLAHL